MLGSRRAPNICVCVCVCFELDCSERKRAADHPSGGTHEELFSQQLSGTRPLDAMLDAPPLLLLRRPFQVPTLSAASRGAKGVQELFSTSTGALLSPSPTKSPTLRRQPPRPSASPPLTLLSFVKSS